MGRINRMKIFKILRDSDHYMEFSTDLEEMLDEIGPKIGDLEFMHFSRHNLRLGEHWTDFSGTFKKVKSNASQTPDITCWRGATLVLSAQARDLLGEQLSSYGELLPIRCNDETYYIFNCLELASIDKSLSKQTPLEHGLIEFQKIVFNENDIAGKLLFKSQEEGCTSIFCGEAFAKLLDQTNLKGLKLSENLSALF
jgi:hypothetical protein